jgi:asparagine synthase (glutamine-hydrolysing)
MAGAYVGWLGPPGEARAATIRRIEALQRTRPALAAVVETDHCRFWSEGLPVVRLATGVVLGRLHPTGRGEPPVPDERGLLDRFWGGYIAIFDADDGAGLLRAPLGDLPCYWAPQGNGAVVASSPRLALAAGGRAPRVAWAALARQLGFGTVSTAETCLDGIRELRGGDRLDVRSGAIRRTTRWSPWTFVRARRGTGDADADAIGLRQLIIDCVAATASRHPNVLLKLSGGLDSSIVAAALAAAGRPFASLTLFTDDGAGDERDYARIVAAHLGVRLIESRRDPLQLDFDQSPSSGLARPSFPGFRQEADRLADAVAASLGATAVIDGGGGDNVFCSLQSAAAVADCLLDWRGLGALGRTTRSLASIAQVSLAHVLRRAVLRAGSARRWYRWERDTLFLSAAAAASVPPQPDHPWLTAPARTPPGRAAHVALIAAAQSYVEGLDSDRDPPTLAPLLAQPVVEQCLSVPSWHWFDQGRNRALARRAFAADLPASIARRRSKGSPECFVAQAFEVHRAALRDRLLGGLLAEGGLIDVPALARALDERRPPLDWSLNRIMTLLDAEIWARAWAG